VNTIKKRTERFHVGPNLAGRALRGDNYEWKIWIVFEFAGKTQRPYRFDVCAAQRAAVQVKN
jgi:hypothetical protein